MGVMLNSDLPENPASEPASRPARLRFAGFLRTRRGQGASIAGLLALFAWAFWYNEHRTLTWGQTFNPVYWYHRWRGEDLYSPDEAMLLRGRHDWPEVALTFDDGPHRQSRGFILDTLKRYNVKATFFDVGARMTQNPDLLLRTIAEGHEIANHSFNHRRLPKLSPPERHREINDTDITFFRLTGRHLAFLRPPGMNMTPETLEETKQLGYVVVNYTTASNDFNRHETTAHIVDRTLRRTGNGSIILLHDYPGTAIALPQILEALQKDGYRFVTISEMIAHLPDRPRQQITAFMRAQEDAPALARIPAKVETPPAPLVTPQPPLHAAKK